MTSNLAARLAAELRRDNELASHEWRRPDGSHPFPEDRPLGPGVWTCVRAWCGATWTAGAEEPRGECPESAIPRPTCCDTTGVLHRWYCSAVPMDQREQPPDGDLW